MILEPGTFKVSEKRKAIPDWVKVQAVLNAIAAGKLPHQKERTFQPALDARSIQYDHRPPLNARPFDTEAGDFIPPQNDPLFIDAILTDEHLYRTTGRKPGAERTVTTRGSDVGEAARIRDIQETEARHQAIMAAKAGLATNDMGAVIDGLAPVGRSIPKPTRKIPSRPFNSKGKRKIGCGHAQRN